jgi:hypothetical protein
VQGTTPFYKLGDRFLRAALAVEPAEDIDTIKLLRGDIRPSRPVRTRVTMGKRPVDLIVGTDISTKLLSDAAVKALTTAGITGWTTYPVEVLGPPGVRIAGYRGLSATGRCGPIDKSRSRRELRPPRVPNAAAYWAWMGLYFDEATWDRSDLFMPQDRTLFIFATELVRATVAVHKLTNFNFIPVDDVESLVP